MNQKPTWLIYAAEVRERLGKMPSTKSGKAYDRHLYSTWLTAIKEKGYEGSEKDWDFLVHNFDKVNKKRV